MCCESAPLLPGRKQGGRGAQPVGAAAPAGTNTHRVYSHLLAPREHPDYDRRAVKPPTWETFKNRTQFTCLRGFGEKDGPLVGFVEELEQHSRTYELGDVIWPSYSTTSPQTSATLPMMNADLTRAPARPLGHALVGPAISAAVHAAGRGAADAGGEAGRALARHGHRRAGRALHRRLREPDDAGFGQPVRAVSEFPASLRGMDALGQKLSALVSLNFGHYFLKDVTYADRRQDGAGAA